MRIEMTNKQGYLIMPNPPLVDRLQDLSRARVLVVGDLILDHYVRGITERTSPEAPVAVVLFQEEQKIPGGAANVARNVQAFGATACCIGVIGDDAEGRCLRSRLEMLGIDCSALVTAAGRPTTTKTRIISQNQQMLRLDRECNDPISEPEERAVVDACTNALDHCDAVVLSDYAKGVLTPNVVQRIVTEASARGIPLFVDPKGRDFSRYQGAFALTPNAKEAAEATGFATADFGGLTRAAEAILRITECGVVAITRGSEGLALFERGQEPLFIRATAREVFDVTGAGDTFVAFFAMGIGTGVPAADAARLANVAAGIVVGKIGAATVSRFELRSALQPDALGRKLRTVEELRELGNELRANGRTIVFTNGCFDFIHAGHVSLLQEARALGDALVLATNTDEVITRLKGAPRPIIKQGQREKLLAAIQAVDYIVPFSDPTPHELIRLLRPDILVKGSNYKQDQVEGHEIVQEYGGKVVLLKVLEDISTRDLIAQRKAEH